MKTKLCLGVGKSFGLPPAEQIQLFRKTGFDGFFIEWEKGIDLQAIRACADKWGMIFQSVHAPFWQARCMWYPHERTEEGLQELLACVEDSAVCNVPIVVMHAFIGFDDHEPNQMGIENFRKVVERAKELGVKIAFENTEGEEYLAALMDAFKDYDNVGFCWDTGHEICYNRSKDMTALYGNRLIATHLNDNLGISASDGTITWLDDLHLLPFDGVADWQNIVDRLEDCGFDGLYTLELTTASKPDRHENDAYAAMPIEEYVAEVYARAKKIIVLKEKRKEENIV
ncbi:MAG: sugar phosphate isomerase/epimerase [Clostridia bacterium]|nr:sugar phosphate isomerase/epimerase [Clostridia bacterium]